MSPISCSPHELTRGPTVKSIRSQTRRTQEQVKARSRLDRSCDGGEILASTGAEGRDCASCVGEGQSECGVCRVRVHENEVVCRRRGHGEHPFADVGPRERLADRAR